MNTNFLQLCLIKRLSYQSTLEIVAETVSMDIDI